MLQRLEEIERELDSYYRGWRQWFVPNRMQRCQALRWEARTIREAQERLLTAIATRTSAAPTCAT
jgi:hypothetical protein